MPPPCQESAGNVKQLVRRLTRNFSLRKEVRKEEGDETICISKQLRRGFLPAGRSFNAMHTPWLLQRHPVGTFELRENLCHWSYLNPSVHVTMLQRNLAHVRHCGNLFANFPLDQDMLEGQADP